jgi:hypothetical protein
MNTMDNSKAIKTMEKQAMQKYLEKLSTAEMRKITLFTSFPHTGTPNISNPVYFVLVDDIAKFQSLNSGKVNN